MGGKPLAKPIVGMDALANGQGYRFVAADGGVFDFGAATFLGSMGGKSSSAPIVGMAASGSELPPPEVGGFCCLCQQAQVSGPLPTMSAS